MWGKSRDKLKTRQWCPFSSILFYLQRWITGTMKFWIIQDNTKSMFVHAKLNCWKRQVNIFSSEYTNRSTSNRDQQGLLYMLIIVKIYGYLTSQRCSQSDIVASSILHPHQVFFFFLVLFFFYYFFFRCNTMVLNKVCNWVVKNNKLNATATVLIGRKHWVIISHNFA